MGVSIFWDNSNIWLVGRNVCAVKEPGKESDFRIHFKNLLEFAANGQKVEYAYAAGSIPPPNDDLWAWFTKLGITLDKPERSISGNEVNVDELVHLAMANRAIDIHPNHERFVLLTGDGAGYNQGKGFIAQLNRVLQMGNEIEVVSWDAGCNRNLKTFAQTHGTYRSLESVYDHVTFVENQRRAT
jgi:hypothetical protein